MYQHLILLTWEHFLSPIAEVEQSMKNTLLSRLRIIKKVMFNNIIKKTKNSGEIHCYYHKWNDKFLRNIGRPTNLETRELVVGEWTMKSIPWWLIARSEKLPNIP